MWEAGIKMTWGHAQADGRREVGLMHGVSSRVRATPCVTGRARDFELAGRLPTSREHRPAVTALIPPQALASLGATGGDAAPLTTKWVKRRRHWGTTAGDHNREILDFRAKCNSTKGLN